MERTILKLGLVSMLTLMPISGKCGESLETLVQDKFVEFVMEKTGFKSYMCTPPVIERFEFEDISDKTSIFSAKREFGYCIADDLTYLGTLRVEKKRTFEDGKDETEYVAESVFDFNNSKFGDFFEKKNYDFVCNAEFECIELN